VWVNLSATVLPVLTARLREIRRRFVSEILVPVSSSGRGGMRALSKADCGRTDRFSRDLLLFSRLAALEDCLFREGTRRNGLVAVASRQAYVLQSPSFWALAIIAFGVAFFLFRSQ